MHTVACDPVLLTSLHLVSYLVNSEQSGEEGGGASAEIISSLCQKQSDELDI